MAKQTINIGTSANSKDGDIIRDAFNKTNQNFDEIYNALTDGVNFAQVNSDWTATTGFAAILNKPTIPTNTNQLTNGAGFITSTDRLVNGNKIVSLSTEGTLTTPGDIQLGTDSYLRFPDNSFQATAFVGIATTAEGLSNAGNATIVVDPLGANNIWTFDTSGRLTVPTIFPATFTAIVNPAHYSGEGSLVLEGDAWSFEVSFVLNANGAVETQITNNTPWPSNPGYLDGYQFNFTVADHGIPGYTFTLTLIDIQNPGPMMYTTNLAASIPPTLPATVSSPETIKLTADATSWTFSPDGNLTVPGAIKQGINKLDLNENNNGNVYLTTTTDDTTALFMTPTGIQTYATESVSLQAGAGLAALETVYNDQLAMLNDFWSQVSGEAGYPWGITLPLSSNTYSEIIQLAPGTISNQTILTVTANSVSNAWTTWQNALSDTSVGITVGNSSWAFKSNGSFAVNNNEVHIATNNWGQVAFANTNTVVYTQRSNNNLASIRVHATIEGDEDGDTTGRHSQACDMMIVRRVSNLGVSTVDSVVYGVIYTGAGPLATLDAQWNAVTNKIEITATPVSTTNLVFVKVYATEVASGD